MTQQTPERERVRSYLVGQAEKKTFAELRPTVDEARAAFLAELEGVSETQAAYRPTEGGEGEGAWGIAEVVRHLIQSEERVGRAVQRLGTGGPPGEKAVPGRLVGHEGETMPQLLEALKGSRAQLLQAAESIDGKEDLGPASDHPFFGPLNCRAWFLFQRVHDIDHTRQIQKTKAEAGYPKA